MKNKRNEEFTLIELLIVVAIIAIICFSGVRFIKSGNVALILRFGNLVGNTYEEQVHEPGLMLAFPYISYFIRSVLPV